MALPARVAITGASGFIGRALATGLQARGVAVVGVTRSARAPLPAGVEVALITGLEDRAGLSRAFAGAEAVIHLAARVHVLREREADPLSAFRAVNVAGSRHVAEAAFAAGAGQVVHASSIKALGEHSARPWVETDEPAPETPYGRSKRESELVVCESARAHGRAARVLRLPLVYGPGVGANMLRLLRAVDRGWPLPLGGLENRRSLLYLGNLVVAVEAALRAPPGQEIFHVTDLQDVSTSELLRLVGEGLGRKTRLLPAPVGLLGLAGRLGDRLAPVVPLPITTAAVQRLTGSLAMDAGKLAREAGYAPPTSLAEGLAETARWYRATTHGRHA